MFGSKIGEFAGEKLGGLIGAKFATEKATETLGEEAVKRAVGTLPFDEGIKSYGQKLTAKAADLIINTGKTAGSSIGKAIGKTAGVVDGVYLGTKAGEYIEDKLAKAIDSKNHDAWFITMKKNSKQYYLTLNSKELVSEDPRKAAILSKKDGFESDKDIQEKLTKDGVFEALKEFDDIQVVGFEKAKVN